MKNIPTILFVGVFFFSVPCFGDRLALAEDLFRKGEWALCHRECRRALLDGAAPTERFQLLDAMSAVRSGAAAEDVAPRLKAITQENLDRQVSTIASYELGRQLWRTGHTREAFDAFTVTFYSTTNKELFLRSACSIFLLMKEVPALEQGQEDLISQINTSRDQWYGALFAQCGKPKAVDKNPNAPGWFIAFYRSQISPAIGSRCTLEPSCSEYYCQAKAKHGIKAVPMIADRLFREPEVNSEKQNPLIMEDGQIRYRDPVENHDFWMKK